MEARRRELETWIANTRRNQKIFGVALVPATIIALVLGSFAVLLVALSAVTGLWVLHAHVESHRATLAELARRARPPEGPQTGGHRRWRTG